MKILFYLGHPAHFHLFYQSIIQLKSKQNDVFVSIKSKDVLVDLLNESRIHYTNLAASLTRNENKIDMLKMFIKRLKNLYLLTRKSRPDLLIGSAAEIALVGKYFKIPSLVFFEDDLREVKQWARLTAPFADLLICPISCSAGKWGHKTISHDSFHELAYLNEKYFKPDFNRVKTLCLNKERFFILRFAKLNAYHDAGKTGLSPDIVAEIIRLLEPHGKVHISSERELEPQFEKYRIQINPLDMHHALYFADMYIGDSQTMTAEAAVLGTPALRFNDFVGKLGYLEELEHKYGLTYGIKTDEPQKLINKIRELLGLPNLKEEWQERRKKMLSEKIDLTRLIVWLIENYPQSAEEIMNNPDSQWRFL